MKKFIKTKLGAFIVSSFLAFSLLVLTAVFGYEVKDGLWVKMLILIPAFVLYSSLTASDKSKSYSKKKPISEQDEKSAKRKKMMENISKNSNKNKL
tara:strand:- start:255 stop:542 length:288 start_codon:yes stop_codon:yes gene_type:complete